MGANGAVKALKVLENLEKILAIELFNAAQAMEFRRPEKTSPLLEKLLDEFRRRVPFVENDNIMYKEMEKSRNFIAHFNLKALGL